MEKQKIRQASLWDVVFGTHGVKEGFDRLSICQSSGDFKRLKEIDTFLPELKAQLGFMFIVARLIHFRERPLTPFNQ